MYFALNQQEAIARETQSAKSLAKTPGKKAQALNALKRRKVQEQLATRIDGWLLQVEELLGSIEEAQATAVVLLRLKQGNEALKAAQAGYTLDDVANILRDMDDAKEHAEEVNRAIAENLTAADDEAVEAELAALEAAERGDESEKVSSVQVEEAAAAAAAAVGAKLPAVPDIVTTPDMPDAPLGTGVGGGAEVEEEEEGNGKTLVPA